MIQLKPHLKLVYVSRNILVSVFLFHN